jgi:hypothetical protein
MLVDAVDVKYIEHYTLEVTFETGEKGLLDLSFLTHEGGVFERFKDIDYFKKVYVNKELGVLCWPGDVDIAPETVYSLATGKPLPDWMEAESDDTVIKSGSED